MTTLYLICEGQTELAFVKSVIAPHLQARSGILTMPILVTTRRLGSEVARRGGLSWVKLLADIRRVGRDSRPDTYTTTLIDLYGVSIDFPDRKSLLAQPDTRLRAQAMEQKMAEEVADSRFIPYVQRHEFEALVLVGLDTLKASLDASEDRAGVDRLRADIGHTAPEDVNGQEPPGRRLETRIPSYSKALHGPSVTQAVGLAKLRAHCLRFDAWVSRLEGLEAVSR